MKCIYHYDMDGHSAASIVAQYTGNRKKSDYFERDYMDEFPIDKIKDNEEVWIVDFSFTEDTKHILKELLDKKCNITWIDHHESSLRLEEKYDEFASIKGIRKNGISGAALTYMYCYNRLSIDSILEYLKLVSDFDCWIYKYGKKTDYFKCGIDSVKSDALDEIWVTLFEEFKNKKQDKLNEIINRGEIVYAANIEDNKFLCDRFSYESEIDGKKCLVVNTKRNSKVFGDRINDYPLVAIWLFNGEKYSYSLYTTKDDINCAKIAEKFGGGGHAKAAGFTSKELVLKRKGDK